MRWIRTELGYETDLPPDWGSARVLATREAHGWLLRFGDDEVLLRNPRLRSWSRARGALESCIRARFNGPAASARAPGTRQLGENLPGDAN